ncbi:MAG: hypothetical protein ISR65_10235 [Bacteriovoracaceae bacterium]|nr:hypothetical protein [Bacteriovoracaceae bacterium]
MKIKNLLTLLLIYTAVITLSTGHAAQCPSNFPLLNKSMESIEELYYNSYRSLPHAEAELVSKTYSAISTLFYALGASPYTWQNEQRQVSYLYFAPEELAQTLRRVDAVIENINSLNPTTYGADPTLIEDLQVIRSQIVQFNFYGKVVPMDVFACFGDTAKITFLEAEESNIVTYKLDTIPTETIPTRQRDHINKNMQIFAEDEENLWGDTILEGPYYQVGDVEWSRAKVHYYNGQIIAYSATIHADAIYEDSDGCVFLEEEDRWDLTDPECYVGRIYVRKFMDANFLEIENENYATFDS